MTTVIFTIIGSVIGSLLGNLVIRAVRTHRKHRDPRPRYAGGYQPKRNNQPMSKPPKEE